MSFLPYENNDPKSNRRCVYENEDGDLQIYMKHGPQYFPAITDIMGEREPEIIIELGTHLGGMTSILSDYFPGVEIHTFELSLKTISAETIRILGKRNVTFHKGSLFPEEHTGLVDLLIASGDRRKVLYCDNGNKELEMELYSKYLSFGDLLGCHDWGSEVKVENISGFLEEFNFYPSLKNAELEMKGLFSRFWIKR